MRKVGITLGLFGLLLASVPALPSEEDAASKALIAKALKAMGGAAKLAKFKAVQMKGKGTFHGFGQALPYTGEWAVQPPTQMRFTVESGDGGNAFKMTQVINGDKGWRQLLNMNAQDLKKDEIAEGQEELYTDWVTTLVPLKDSRFKLAPLGKAKVGEREATGIRVSSKGHRDVNLFFDNQTGLLVKSEARVKDLEAGGKELTQEVLYDGYKAFEGMQHPTRVTIRRDGKVYVETEFTEIQPREQLPEATFQRP